jgi:serine/threonine protein phosphatase 1
MNLLHLFARRPQPPAKFVEGRVGYAVGDVHGRADLLGDLIADIEERAQHDARAAGPPVLVFLGDYVDRGPDSAGVLDLLLSGRPANCERRYLRGNHEQAMVAFMDNPAANRGWLIHGGTETMLSYGVQPPASVGASEDDLAAAAAALRASLPPEHLAFLDGLERYVELGGYAFVHAGIDAERALTEQTDGTLYWTRERFLESKRRFTHRVVHGHTPSERPYVDERRIGVDTGAYASGILTAVRLEGEAVTFFSVSADRRRRDP